MGNGPKWMSGGSSRMRTARWILGSGAEIGCSEGRDHRPGFKHEKRLPECCAGITIYKYDNVVSNNIR
jgi:hypothetical protein